MINIKGFDVVNYDTLQGVLFDAYKRSKKTYFRLAREADVNSTQTPINAITANPQNVADSKLILIASLVGVEIVIQYCISGKHYYIKNT